MLDPDTAWRIVRQPKAHLAEMVRYNVNTKENRNIDIFLLSEISLLSVARISPTIDSINVEIKELV